MVLVDTSVWISLYRKESDSIGQKMWALTAANEAAVCGQIWVEFIGGFRKTAVRHEYVRHLCSFPFLDTTRAGFEKAAELLAHFPRLGAGDAIIAATALAAKASLYTLDRDFLPLVSVGLNLL